MRGMAWQGGPSAQALNSQTSLISALNLSKASEASLAAAAARERDLRSEVAAVTEKLKASIADRAELRNHVHALQRMLQSFTGRAEAEQEGGGVWGTGGIVVQVGGSSAGTVVGTTAAADQYPAALSSSTSSLAAPANHEGSSPHALWERVQELTMSEMALNERVRELQEELDMARARGASISMAAMGSNQNFGSKVKFKLGPSLYLL